MASRPSIAYGKATRRTETEISFKSISPIMMRLQDPQALTELPYSNDGVGGECPGIKTGMVNPHLGYVGPGTLVCRVLEVGLKVSKRRSEVSDIVKEELFDPCDRGIRSSGVVMQKHECNVVPVLSLAPRECCCSLGKKEPGNTGDVHLGGVRDIAVPDVQFMHFSVARCESGAAKVRGPEVFACVERNRCWRRSVIKVGQKLELDDRCAENPVRRDPAPDSGILRSESRVEEGLFEACSVHRSTGDLKVDLYIYVDRAGVLELTPATKQFRNQTPSTTNSGLPHSGRRRGQALFPRHPVPFGSGSAGHRPRIVSRRCSAASSPRTPIVLRSA